MSINIIRSMLEKLPGGLALLCIINVQNIKRLKPNIYCLQQRGCLDGVPCDNGEGLTDVGVISKAQNVRKRLKCFRGLEIFYHVGPNL